MCFLSAGSASGTATLPDLSSGTEFPPGFSFLEEASKANKDGDGTNTGGNDGSSSAATASAQSDIIKVSDNQGDKSGSAANQDITYTQRVLETMPEETRILLMVAFGLVGLTIFLTHRIWPTCCKHLDLVFAGDHFIEDTHAKRMLATRLGASFTLMLPCIIGIAAVSIFGAENFLNTKGLEPAMSLDPPLPKVVTNTAFFKHVEVHIAAFAPINTVACGGILLGETAKALACTRADENTNAGSGRSDATFCRITLRCAVSSELRGTSDVAMSFPNPFQNIRWTVTPDAWDGEHIVANIADVLTARKDDHTLSGTVDNPTVLSFGTIRTRFRNLLGAKDPLTTGFEYGLQLSWLGESVAHSKPGSTTNADGMHHVSFRFELEESVFVSEWSDKLAYESRLGTVLTLLLTAMSVMRVAKTFLELGIDSLLIWRAKSVDAEVQAPADVVRRKRILEEQFITTTPGSGASSGVAKHQRTRRLSEIGRRLSANKIRPPVTEAGVEMTSLAGRDAMANTLSIEPPTRQEFELQQKRIEEQQRSIDNLMRMVNALGGGLPSNSAGVLEAAESAVKNTPANSDHSSLTCIGTFLGDDWSRHVDANGVPYYVNQKTGVSQWEKPPGNEDLIADALGSEQTSANVMTTNPMVNNSRRRSSFAKSRRRSSVKAALHNIAEKQHGEPMA
eukprot:g3740.t1